VKWTLDDLFGDLLFVKGRTVPTPQRIGRRPDGGKESFHAINTGVTFCANTGDDNSDIFAVETAAALGAEREPPPAA
jgi:hypothetical protein